MPPWGVNFTALLSRLSQDLADLPQVGRRHGGQFAGALQPETPAPFPSARRRNSEASSCSSPGRSTGSAFSSTRPASIFDISRMSLMMDIRCSPLFRMVATFFSAGSESDRSRPSSWANPRTAFIGVRISWLMLARNRLFAWFAASASSLATSSSCVLTSTSSSKWCRYRSSSASAVFFWVMSDAGADEKVETAAVVDRNTVPFHHQDRPGPGFHPVDVDGRRPDPGSSRGTRSLEPRGPLRGRTRSGNPSRRPRTLRSRALRPWSCSCAPFFPRRRWPQ